MVTKDKAETCAQLEASYEVLDEVPAHSNGWKGGFMLLRKGVLLGSC